MIAACLIAAALRAVSPAAAAPADTLPSSEWQATLAHTRQHIMDAASPAWRTTSIGIQRKTSRGSLMLQALRTERFSLWDEAVIVDAYRTLWSEAYGNVRLQVTPGAEVLPRLDARGELFQAISGGWEASASYRRQRFPKATAQAFGAGIGHYTGRWYLRQQVLLASVANDLAPSAVFSARYYLSGTRNSLNASAGAGEEVLEIAPGGEERTVEVTTSGSRFLSLGVQRDLLPALGVSLSATYNDYDRIADRWMLSIGTTVYW